MGGRRHSYKEKKKEKKRGENGEEKEGGKREKKKGRKLTGYFVSGPSLLGELVN